MHHTGVRLIVIVPSADVFGTMVPLLYRWEGALFQMAFLHLNTLCECGQCIPIAAYM